MIPTTCRYPRKKIFVRFDFSVHKSKKTARKFEIFFKKLEFRHLAYTLVNEAQWQETSSTNRVQLLSNPKSVGQITACYFKKIKQFHFLIDGYNSFSLQCNHLLNFQLKLTIRCGSRALFEFDFGRRLSCVNNFLLLVLGKENRRSLDKSVMNLFRWIISL